MMLVKQFLSTLSMFTSAAILSAAVAYIPFEDNVKVISSDGKERNGIIYGRIKYEQGMSGKGLMVKRDAYDQVTTVSFSSLPQMNLIQGTISFYFKPEWEMTDKQTHYMLYFYTKGFRIYAVKTKSGKIDISVCSPKQIQLLSKPRLKKGQWHNFVITWNLAQGKAAFYLDNNLMVERSISTDLIKIPEEEKKLSLWLGTPGSNRFKAKSGDGVYDDLKIYDKYMNSSDIRKLSLTTTEKTKLEKLNISPQQFVSLKTEFILGKTASTNTIPVFFVKTSQGNGILYYSPISQKLTISFSCGSNKRIIQSMYPIAPGSKQIFSIHQVGKTLYFYIDGAQQGTAALQNSYNLNLKEIFVFPDMKQTTILSMESLKHEEANLFSSAFKVESESSMEKQLWSLNNAATRSNKYRQAVSLNGMWRTYPTNQYTAVPPDSGFGYMRVPGSYRSPLFNIYHEKAGKLESLNWKWKNKPLIKYLSGWYQRSFSIPEQMKGKNIFLNFENINGDYARIYVNGKLVDHFTQKSSYYSAIPNPRKIDITSLCKKENTVTIFIERKYSKLWRGIPSIADHCNMAMGNVWLESSQSSVQLQRVLVFPSVKRKQADFRIRIKNPAKYTGKAMLQLMFSKDGKIDKRFIHNCTLDGNENEIIKFSASWENPDLWDYEHPVLYRMEAILSLDNGKSDMSWEQNFGFREFEVKPDNFYLNEKITHLRMWSSPAFDRLRFSYGTPKGVKAYVNNIKYLNYNAVRCNPITGLESLTHVDNYYTESDRQGVLNLVSMPPYDGGDKKLYKEDLEKFVEAYANHPSIVMWYTDFNTCSYPWNQDPAKLNDTDYLPENKILERQKAAYAGKKIEKLDPSRPTFQHAGGNSGKVFTSMNYQSLGVPLQEQEDWPAQWARKHKQPLMVVESGFPFAPQFMHFKSKPRQQLNAEHAARYFGDAVYKDELRPSYAFGFCDIQPFNSWNFNYLRLKKLMYYNVVKAWRAYGMSGIGDFPGGHDLYEQFVTYRHVSVAGDFTDNIKRPGLFPDRLYGSSETQTHMISDYTKPSPVAEYNRNAFCPFSFFIGDAPENFTAKTHSYYSGEEFVKSLIAVNDHTKAAMLRADWTLKLENVLIQHGDLELNMPAGGISKEKIRLKVPDIGSRKDAVICVKVYSESGKRIFSEEFTLQFFPKKQVGHFGDTDTAIYDPQGKTAALLKKAGFIYTKVKSIEDIRKARLLIVGKDALASGTPDFIRKIDEEKLVEKGLNILIFEQQTGNIANLVMETPSYRDAFIRTGDSPLLAGLRPGDFSNWRGGVDSVPAYILSDEGTPHYPRSKWKCGNTGIVSANVIRKPQYGNFRSILDCGFNLMFTPLLMLQKQRGQVLFCQMDVTGRYGIDPVATILTDNMLKVMSQPQMPIQMNKASYFGDNKTFELLKEAGMDLKRIHEINSDKIFRDTQSVILGNFEYDANIKENLRKALANVVRESGVVVATSETPLDCLPGNLTEKQKRIFKTQLPALPDPVLKSIANADLYFRDEQILKVLNPSPSWLIHCKPALIAKLEKNLGALVLFRLPLEMTGFWNTEKVQRVFFSILNNLNLRQGRELKLFSGEKYRHNTMMADEESIVPDNWKLALDPQNEGLNQEWAKHPERIPAERAIKVNSSWERQGVRDSNKYIKYSKGIKSSLICPYDGYAWYKTNVFIPEVWRGKKITFNSGSIDDNDWTYLNGNLIGSTTFDNSSKPYRQNRCYSIPSNIINFGQQNTILIRVYDRWGDGGILSPPSLRARKTSLNNEWSPYYKNLDFYDVEAFHNW